MQTLAPNETAERLAALRQQHRDLDVLIAGLALDPRADTLMVQRLKKRKLRLKDCIAKLESMLIPDEPA